MDEWTVEFCRCQTKSVRSIHMEEGAWICREERVLVEELKEGGEIVSGEQGVGRVSGRRSRRKEKGWREDKDVGGRSGEGGADVVQHSHLHPPLTIEIKK